MLKYLRKLCAPSQSVLSFAQTYLDALHEAAYIYSLTGNLEYTNAPGKALLLRIFSDPDAKYDQIEFLSAFTPTDEKDVFLLGEDFFKLRESPFAGKILLRLFPRPRDLHLRRLSKALQILPWGIISVVPRDGAMRVTFANEGTGRMLEIPVERIIGLDLYEILTVTGFSQDLDKLFPLDKNKEIELKFTVDNVIRWISFRVIPGGELTSGAFLILEDKTDQKVREGHYFQAQRLEALGQLAGGVAHDFNNILSIIDGYARIAKKAAPDNERAQTYLDHISKAVYRGGTLTSRLLTFGRHKVSRDKVFDLGQLVKDQETLLRPLMDASITLSIEVHKDIPVEVSPDNICQILFNLCINARDAMPEGGTLIIECLRDDKTKQAILQVVDNGCGMDFAIQSRIFDPFFTTKDQGKGTGLGLSMVYGMVTDMRGSIAVQSQPGKGSVFTVHFPLSDKIPSQANGKKIPASKADLTGITALIAEDEPDLLKLVSGAMEDMGAKVLCASDGNHALVIQDEHQGKIDFLLTDIVMPDMNGVKLAELFSACRPDSKILFMSGYPAGMQSGRVNLPEGAFLMPKPVNFEQLPEIVHGILRSDNDNENLEELRALAGQWRPA